MEGTPGLGVGTPLVGCEGGDETGAVGAGLAEGGALTAVCTGDDGRIAEGGAEAAPDFAALVTWGGMLEPMRR